MRSKVRACDKGKEGLEDSSSGGLWTDSLSLYEIREKESSVMTVKAIERES